MMYTFQQEKIQLPTLSPVKLRYELTVTPGNAFCLVTFLEFNLTF